MLLDILVSKHSFRYEILQLLLSCILFCSISMRVGSGASISGNTPTSEQVQKLESEDVKDAPADGIYVHGLYLEGASWSKKESHLIEAARGELVQHIQGARTHARASLAQAQSSLAGFPATT